MIIKPMRDKKTGKILKNYEICERMEDELNALKNGGEDELTTFYKIFGGNSSTADEVMNFLAEVRKQPTPQAKQNYIKNYIYPVK